MAAHSLGAVWNHRGNIAPTDSKFPYRSRRRRSKIFKFGGGASEGEHSPYHTLKHRSEHLISRRYPDNHSPFDIQLLSLGTHEVSTLLALIKGGCREVDVGGDTLEVCLLEAKVEAKRQFGIVLGEILSRFVMSVMHRSLADVRGGHAFAC